MPMASSRPVPVHVLHPQICSFFLGALEGAPLSLPSLELLTLHLDEAADGRRPAFTFGVPLVSQMGGEGVCSALATLVAQGVLPALKQARASVFWGVFTLMAASHIRGPSKNGVSCTMCGCYARPAQAVCLLMQCLCCMHIW